MSSYEGKRERLLDEWDAKCRAWGVDPETTLVWPPVYDTQYDPATLTPPRPREPQKWAEITQENLDCPDCVIRFTTLPGYPIRLFPCAKHGEPVEKPRHEYGPPSGWKPDPKDLPELEGEGDRYVPVMCRSPSYPVDRGFYYKPYPISMADIPLFAEEGWRDVDGVPTQYRERHPLNAARRAHNAEIQKSGRCRIADCPHTRGWENG